MPSPSTTSLSKGTDGLAKEDGRRKRVRKASLKWSFMVCRVLNNRCSLVLVIENYERTTVIAKVLREIVGSNWSYYVLILKSFLHSTS